VAEIEEFVTIHLDKNPQSGYIYPWNHELDSHKRVRVINRRGEIEAEAKVTERVDPGVIFIPFHFAEAAANVLTNPALDPIAKISEFKVCAVHVEAAEE